MKIVILSRNPRSYSTQRLREASRQRNHIVRVLDTLKFSIDVEHHNPDLSYCSKRLGHIDAVIPRIGASITFYGTAVVRQFEQMGVYTLNHAQAIATSRDKLRSMQILSKYDIGIPTSGFVKDKGDVLPAIKRVGGAPVIIKLLEGTQGVGVILAESVKMAESIIQTLQSTKQNVLIQKFVAESRGKDVRAFVVGGKVVAAIRRKAVGQEFRSNVHLGGTTEAIELDPEYERTAVRATQILGLTVAGVDMLEGENGPQIAEVNSSPGLEGIEKATGLDVAGAVIEHLEEQVLFPSLDLRQRLTLKSGYGVAEFIVDPKSPLAGKTLADSGLRDKDVLVMTLERSDAVIPNPRGSRQITAGDKLLCFGKLDTLKELVPPPRKKRRKKAVAKKKG